MLEADANAEMSELTAENARLKEELEQAKSRQLGKFQVAVETCVNSYGECYPCRMFIKGTGVNIHRCKLGLLELSTGMAPKPGPGCPRWEGENDQQAKTLL